MEAIRLLKRRPWGIAGAVILLAVILLAILSPIIAPYHYNNIDLDHRMEAPGRDYIMGTDNLGRDIFSRFLYGSRPYLETGLIAIGTATVLGLLLGFISTIVNTKATSILRIAFIIPLFLVALAVLAIILFLPTQVSGVGSLLSTIPFIKPERTTLIIGLLLSFILFPSVYTASQAAFKAGNISGGEAGAFNLRALGRGFIPLLPLILVNLGIAVGAAVLIIAPMTYYGFGVPPPIPEWGGMLSGTGRTYMIQAPWIFLFPVMALGVTILGFIFFGIAMGEIWIPRFPRVSAGSI